MRRPVRRQQPVPGREPLPRLGGGRERLLDAVRHVLITLLALALLLGIFWIVSGAAELFTALSHRTMRGRGWTALMGLLSVLAGVLVLVYPGISLLVLAVVLSVWLLVFGVMEITLAFRIRSLGR